MDFQQKALEKDSTPFRARAVTGGGQWRLAQPKQKTPWLGKQRIDYRLTFAVAMSIFLFFFLNDFILGNTSLLQRCLRHPFSHFCDPADDWYDVDPNAEEDSKDAQSLNEIPQYVLDYAPYVHLYSEEPFWPCDMAEHLLHINPELNYTPIEDEPTLNLTNLDELNAYEKGRHVFLTSNDNVEDRPDWLVGESNIPARLDNETVATSTSQSKIRMAQAKLIDDSKGGRSNAPSVLLVLNKGNGVVDAFWFFFYSYNLGNVVLNVRFGNHVGDWEHTLVRFQYGQPKAVFFSEHNFGSAYSYSAVEKIGKRPVVYSAVGTHAMYATPGDHPYILPLGLLHDVTDRGPLWDPALNLHTYTYDYPSDTLRASNHTPESPIEWFNFAGHWGDKFYPLEDKRQYGIGGEYHYVSGPLGPRFKNLNRRKLCQGSDSDPCVIKHWLAGEDIQEFPASGEGEDWPEHAEMITPAT